MHDKIHKQEIIVRIAVIIMLIAVPVLLLWYQDSFNKKEFPPGAKVFTLTGIANQGRWTLETVSALNSWWKTFSKAEIHVEEGDLVVLRLQSADVTHGFYAPTLGIGPLYIEPGHVKTITFRASSNGIHPYYCIAVCGECHFFMRGEIFVGDVRSDPALEFAEACQHNAPLPAANNAFERGKYLFLTKGCISCHGENGRGGQYDPNYIKQTVPDLNKLATRISIESKEDADSLVAHIEDGEGPDDLEILTLDIPRKRVVIAKYRSVRDVIKQGRPAARADTTSFTPPLVMPAWGDKLTDKDIDDILIYLFSVQVYEDVD